MDFFKVKRFRKAHKRDPEKDLDDKPVPQPEQPKSENGGEDLSKSSPKTDLATDFEDDDDDFITNEVKRRLKELRKNSFMALIPEEEELFAEEDEEGEEGGDTSSSEWRDAEVKGHQWWVGFDAAYDKYCEHMLFFDRMISKQLKEAGTQVLPTPSPRSASKKLTSPFRCLYLKSFEDGEETEHLQQPQNDPYQDLEVAYVAHICLTWEALHCQYAQLNQVILCQTENPICYSHTAQQFQQFQVLLQRFIENEPFEEGVRPEIYARARNLLPKHLQIPKVQGAVEKEMVEVESDLTVHAPGLLRIIENSILTFYIFLKMDKRKANGVRNLFGVHNMATPLQQVLTSLEKKQTRLKELKRRTKGWKKKSWPQTREDVTLLFGLIDVKVLSRVLRVVRISKEQLFWCEEKMKKLDLTDGKLHRDFSPILFPC